MVMKVRNALNQLAPILIDLNLDSSNSSQGRRDITAWTPTLAFPLRPAISLAPTTAATQHHQPLCPTSRTRSRSRERTNSTRTWTTPLFHHSAHDSASSTPTSPTPFEARAYIRKPNAAYDGSYRGNLHHHLWSASTAAIREQIEAQRERSRDKHPPRPCRFCEPARSKCTWRISRGMNVLYT